MFFFGGVLLHFQLDVDLNYLLPNFKRMFPVLISIVEMGSKKPPAQLDTVFIFQPPEV